MKNFKPLIFTNVRQWDNSKITLEMFVPGINSGAYDKSLHIKIRIKETVKKWFGKAKEISIFSDITLSIEEVKQLRDECNKILEL